jgi:hypothetical protein
VKWGRPAGSGLAAHAAPAIVLSHPPYPSLALPTTPAGRPPLMVVAHSIGCYMVVKAVHRILTAPRTRPPGHAGPPLHRPSPWLTRGGCVALDEPAARSSSLPCHTGRASRQELITGGPSTGGQPGTSGVPPIVQVVGLGHVCVQPTTGCGCGDCKSKCTSGAKGICFQKLPLLWLQLQVRPSFPTCETQICRTLCNI